MYNILYENYLKMLKIQLCRILSSDFTCKNRKIVLTSYLEFHIIEVPKAVKEYEKSPQDAVLQWMMFLDNPNKEEVTKIMEKNEDIKEAKEELNQLSRDETLRRIALKEELLRMDINQAKADAAKYGRAEGEKDTKEKMIKNYMK